MADRLNVTIKNGLASPNCVVDFQLQAWVLGTTAGTTEITDYVLEWNDPSEMELYNKHPKDRGTISYVTQELEVNNADGTFTIGAAGGVFPNGSSDFEETAKLQVKLTLAYKGVTQVVWDYTGILAEPIYRQLNRCVLTAEHPLNRAEDRTMQMKTFETDWTVGLNI